MSLAFIARLSLFDHSPSVVIRRIAVHGMDMQTGIAAQCLRRILDDKVRPLNSVIGRDVFSWSSGCRAAPREPGLVDVRLKFSHARRGRAFVNNAGPLGYHIEQHGALAVIHSRSLQPFRNNRLAILPGTKHKIGKLVAQDRLLALAVVECVEQGQSLVALLAEWPHGLSSFDVERRLSARQSRRENAAFAGNGNVECQMMAAELQHPRIFFRRLAKDRDVVEVFPKHVAAQPAAPRRWTSAAGRRSSVTRGWSASTRRWPI